MLIEDQNREYCEKEGKLKERSQFLGDLGNLSPEN